MINLTENESSKPSFQHEVDTAVAEGVIGGIVAFMQKNRVDVRPTKNVVCPIKEFTSLLLAEYGEEKALYPFSESLFQHVVNWVNDETPTLNALWNNNELANLRGLGHIIGGAAVGDFLEANRIQVLKLIASIREK